MARKKRTPNKQDAVAPSDESGNRPESEVETGPANRFPIVGIGASAGGLAAFEAFFAGMPGDVDPGMAFVLVQHLAPDHKSILTDLVQRYTRMKVFEVEDGMEVKPNCAYIIPPNRDMAFLNGALQLMEPLAPRGQRLPIDFFFRSLAQDQRERAIGIVLSGTGSDGTLGVRAIKGEGGMVMAQTPGTTEHDGMPRSAIDTGLVDYELAPSEMPAQLMDYVAHAFGKSTWALSATAPGVENATKKILIILRDQAGHDFSHYKPNTLQRRIGRRMAVRHTETMEGYVKCLQQTPGEVEALFRDLLIGVTRFFRDPEAFEALEEKVIPMLFADKPAGAAIRIWCPGCSTGEEAYSIAILLQERLEAVKRNYRVQVFATDIDRQAIATARAGLYPGSIASDISPERLARFFVLEPDGSAYRIHKTIRDLMVFSEQDLIKDPPFSKLDLISCRNLMIYLGNDLQKKLIPLFHYALNPKGALFLGTSETVGELGHLFATLDRKFRLYQRKEDLRGAHRWPLGQFLPFLTSPDKMDPRAAPKSAAASKPPLRELVEQALLEQVAPAASLVDGQGDVLYLHGRTGLYLEPAPGEAGVSNILKMAREGLRQELTMALHKAAGTQETVHYPGLRVKTNGDFARVNLTVRPVAAGPAGTSETPLYLVTLEAAAVSDQGQAHGASALHQAQGPADADPGNDEARVAALKQELRARDEYLQAANEELQTTNEELRSSNEEMQSINEELQSTNEELETAKEELQSLNEELSTVNAELQSKVADLSRLNNDMNNMLSSTGVGTVFVDHQLRILRFTPAATQIINLIQSDVGRPVTHMVSNLVGYDQLAKDVSAVLDTLVAKEVEVRTAAGAWCAMRIQPYRTVDNVIEGAVITFVDITAIKTAQEALRESEERFRRMFDLSPVGVVLVGLDFRFLRCNEAFCRFLGHEEQDLLQKTFMDVTHPDDLEIGREDIRAIRAGELDVVVLETRYLHKSGQTLWGMINIRMLRDGQGHPLYFLSIIQDITSRRTAEEERDKLQSELLQAQKMESVGRLAGGVAHDFNNMLQAIRGCAELALLSLPGDSLVAEHVQEILKASKRSADLTAQLLAFARKQVISPKVVNLNEAISDSLKMIGRLIGENIDLVWMPGANLWHVLIDPTQVSQIMANLASNARDAVAGVGKLIIETKNVLLDQTVASQYAEIQPGDYVQVCVSDTGRGMDHETLANIFEPFFTTKGVGEGTGLGLATVYGIVKQNWGHIHVYSELGVGSTFKIYLPRCEGEAHSFADPPEAQIDGGTETVLLVEDEEAILDIGKAIMEQLGYRVLAARTPGQAIELARGFQGNIDLVVTDVVMPEMNGKDLVNALQSIRPAIRTLYMSGYTGDAIGKQGALQEEINFLQKPFSMRALAEKIREVLKR